jgi:ATP-binding cassette subfamily F protein 3
MAVLLQIRDAHKSYGEQVLLDGAEATLTEDVKVGFIGRNGAGKSTLLRVLLGEEELDRGEVIKHPRLTVGYLRQHDPFQPGESALDFLMRDSGQPDWKCGEVAGEFELKGAYLEGPVKELSGGWQTRVKLAALLLHEPNLLLLDEPTNFLDLRTQILLEHFLRNFRQAALIVSHDRAFLKATCSHTLDLARGKLTMYPGQVDAYLDNVAEQKERDEKTNAAIVSKQKQLQRFIDKNRANANTASQARSKAKQLERLQTTEIADDEATAFIRTPVVEPRRGPAVRCNNLSIGYPDHTVATEIDVEIEHGERAAIVGDNGQGKTTFLRTIVDSLKPVSGSLRWGHGCDLGVYAQHVYTSLPQDQTVQQYLEYNSLPGTTTQQILKVAGAMLFRGGAVKKKINVLSGGERARLCMAGILLNEHNVLILDEPGNHLDVETIEALASALVDYKGTVIFTSHDRHFMKRVATCVIEVRDGHVRNYNGDYDAYVYAVNKEIDDGERERHAKKGGSGGPPPPAKAAGGEAQMDERKLRKELSKAEKAVARFDEKKTELNSQLLSETDPDEALRLHNELTEVTEKLAEAEDRWCELQEQLEAFA